MILKTKSEGGIGVATLEEKHAILCPAQSPALLVFPDDDLLDLTHGAHS